MNIWCRRILQIIVSIILLVTTLAIMASFAQSQSTSLDVKDMAVANTHFTFDLLRECRTDLKNQNVFFAPYSITTALAMTCLGAAGSTADEMKRVLKWSSDIPRKGFGSYLSLLKEASSGKTPGYILVGAQNIYVDNELTMKAKFSAETQEHFASQAQQADFRKNAEGERQKINAWVLEQTRNKIQDLLPSGSIDPLTAMVLVQALYFKGNWMHKFDAMNTRPAKFRTPDGPVNVNMMEQTRDFNFAMSERLKCSAVELPYANNKGDNSSHDLSMLILLPDQDDGLDKLEADLTFDELVELRKIMYSVKVNLKLPRFTVESKFELKKVLARMGMPQAFGDDADFSGMVEQEDAELRISEVFHKAVVEVNEEGSEAAAATAVVMMMRSMPIIEPFIADHPFLFFIVDKRADVILFSGRLVKPPTASEPSQKKKEL